MPHSFFNLELAILGVVLTVHQALLITIHHFIQHAIGLAMKWAFVRNDLVTSQTGLSVWCRSSCSRFNVQLCRGICILLCAKSKSFVMTSFSRKAALMQQVANMSIRESGQEYLRLCEITFTMRSESRANLTIASTPSTCSMYKYASYHVQVQHIMTSRSVTRSTGRHKYSLQFCRRCLCFRVQSWCRYNCVGSCNWSEGCRCWPSGSPSLTGREPALQLHISITW